MTAYGRLAARAEAPAAKPPGPARPAVLAVADDAGLTSVAVAGGRGYFGGARNLTRPADAGAGPPSEARGVVRRVSAAGGAVEELWSGAGGVAAVAPASTGVYFLTYDFGWRRGALLHLPAGGRDAETLATWSSHGSVHSLAVAGDAATWTHSAGASSSVVRSVAARKERPSSTTTLAEGGEIGGADDLCVSGGSAYWISGRRALYRMPIKGKAPAVIFEAPYLSALAAAPGGDILYLGASDGANVAPSRVVRFDLRTRRATTMTATDQPVLTIVAGADAVYFATGPSRGPVDMTRIALRDLAIERVATGQASPVALALDGDTLYWTAGTRLLALSP